MTSQEMMEMIGWTLIHSVWQGLLIGALLWVVLQFLPKSAANARYLTATFSLALLIAVTIATAVYESGTFNQDNYVSATKLPLFLAREFQTSVSGADVAGLSAVTQWLNNVMNLIVAGWAVGILLFSLRLAMGLAYVQHLRHTAQRVDQEFHAMVRHLAASMGIRKTIDIGSSPKLQTPVVVGYLKPIILFPIGMLAGLSTQQVESILLHELSHVKRHDYLVNVIQSITEVVLFFNPFVWHISNTIRAERENCCDDLAVARTSDPIGYAGTLLQLEEIRVHGLAPVLSIHSNKNQLHQRIQRIMEKSVNNRNEKSKTWPLVALVVIGLASASWMSYQTQGKDEPVRPDLPKSTVQSDTTKKNKKESKSATYSRKSITTLDENGQPKEEIIEEFTGDEDLRPLLAPTPFGPIDEPLTMLPPDELFLEFDSVPFTGFHLDEAEWEDFMKEFTDQFQTRFRDFYLKNEPQLQSMMEDIQRKMEEMNGQFGEEWSARMQADMQRRMAEMERHFERFPERHEEMMKRQEERMREMESVMHDKMLRMEEHERNLKEFDREINRELVKDGYLKADEQVETLNWSPDDVLRVNGKKIKPEHKEKYDAIRKKYLSRHSHGRPE